MWLENLWNTLTGQAQEDARTEATNKYNLQQVQETNQANKDIAQQTNETNYKIAQENLGYQRELQEYNKALQQQIFEREDTSYQRTAEDMLKAGLNPLTMQGTNGAGEAVAISPLNNQFRAEQPSAMQAHQAIKSNVTMTPLQAVGSITSGIGNITSMIDSIMTGSLQRDRLRLENQHQNIQNLIEAKRAGIGEEYFDTYIENLRKQDRYNSGKAYSDSKLADINAQNAERELTHKKSIGRYDSDSQISEILTDLQDWFVSGRGDEALNKLCEKYPYFATFFLKTKDSKEGQKEFLDKHEWLKKYIEKMHPQTYKDLYGSGTYTNNSNSSHNSGKF